jgi:NAD(P)-dependent dehydrogenase (short-subunit alcohol dehydrogenase family)
VSCAAIDPLRRWTEIREQNDDVVRYRFAGRDTFVIASPEPDLGCSPSTPAHLFFMRAAARHMAEGGRIVNIGTSILGCSFPFYSVYAASKASLEHYSRALAKELAGKRITVNTVAPGALDTPFFYAAETPESVNAIKMFTGGLGTVDDVVPTIEFLVKPSARWFSGQTLFVNGAFVAR